MKVEIEVTIRTGWRTRTTKWPAEVEALTFDGAALKVFDAVKAAAPEREEARWRIVRLFAGVAQGAGKQQRRSNEI